MQKVGFKLVEKTVVQNRVTTVEVKLHIEVVSRFRPGFFEAGKCATVGQQLLIRYVPPRFRLGIVVGPSVAGKCPGFCAARPQSWLAYWLLSQA